MDLRGLPLGELLLNLDRAGPADIMGTLLGVLRDQGGASGVRLLFADVEERVLNVWGEAGEHTGRATHRVIMEGSTHGRVYVTGRPASAEVAGEPAVIVPVSARSERIGVLEATFDHPPGDGAVELVVATALVMGYVSTAAERWTDEFHVARRRTDMTLAAEIQWNLLPLAALSTERVAVAGALEPAYDIGGDSFDYAYGRQFLWLGIFDAMGHGLTAARLSALAVSAFRNARRRHDPLEVQARFIHDTVSAVFSQEGYVTAQLLAVDLLEPNRSRIVNAGHPPPYLQRGRSAPERLEVAADHPLGMPFPNRLSARPLDLRAGDRLILYSDGVVEARPDMGDPFGEERMLQELVAYRDLSPREAARRLIGSVRAHRAADLTDDATLVVMDLPGGEIGHAP